MGTSDQVHRCKNLENERQIIVRKDSGLSSRLATEILGLSHATFKDTTPGGIAVCVTTTGGITC